MKLQKLHPLLTATLFVTIFVLLYLMFNSPPQMSPVPNTAEIEIEVVQDTPEDRKSTRLNSSHKPISYAVFCLKKK